MKRLLSGIQPTGNLTIGNYLGAIKYFVNMQSDYESYIFIADLHALTSNPDPKELKENIKKIAAIYLACGLSNENTNIFIQSENIYHPMLSWVLECHTYIGEMSRMTQFKEKSISKNKESINGGLFNYPVLMAADILIYQADVIPVGIDQKQHVELCRNIAQRFNQKYGNTFKIPEPVIPQIGAKIMNLQNPLQKMSKTDPNPKGNIYLLDDLTKARKKIMSAVTDSDNIVKYDFDNKPGISNLITIYSAITNKSIDQIENEFKNSNYGNFKKCVADEVVNLLTDIQLKYNEIINSDLLNQILDKGLNKSLELAKITIDNVYRKIGVGR